jgi:hypothetical protein
MENKFLKLTNTVYKLLEFFPESDPLKNRAKDKALAIMEHLILINKTNGWASFEKEKVKAELSEDIDILLGYFWIGKSQGWLNSANCLIVANEYEKIRKGIEPAIELTQKLPGINKPFGLSQESAQIIPSSVLNKEDMPVEKNPINPELTPAKISTRQEKIIEFLSKNEKAQVMDLQTILPDITKRTIRRDLDELLGAGKIIRSGDFNQVFYRVKS